MLVLPNYAKNYAGTIDSSLAFGTGGKFDLLHCGSFLHESNRAALLFSPLPPSLHVMPLSQKVFFFALPLWDFQEFSLVSLPLHFIPHTDESDFALSLDRPQAVISVPERWTARTQKWAIKFIGWIFIHSISDRILSNNVFVVKRWAESSVPIKIAFSKSL